MQSLCCSAFGGGGLVDSVTQRRRLRRAPAPRLVEPPQLQGAPQAVSLPVRGPRHRRLVVQAHATVVQESVASRPGSRSALPQPSSSSSTSSGGSSRDVRWHTSSAHRGARLYQEEALPVFVALDHDVLTPQSKLGYEEALRVGLKALRLLGVTGVSVDVMWGLVEGAGPRRYCWHGYRTLFNLIADMGFKIKANLCFNSSDVVPLPQWVLDLGQEHPDMFYTDRQGHRCTECLSLGVDEAPVLGGRTGLQACRELMQSFRAEFAHMLGGSVTEVLIGLGPRGELRYPSHPTDASGRWEYPGVGEFQCYDQYMLAGLRACAEQVRQPPWGLGGPHDAGTYRALPHQTGFFAHNGNWTSPYGRFFLQWYSEMLVRHAARLLGAASEVFAGAPVLLNAKVPGCHWWYNTPSHAAELTAGFYQTSSREGYLPAFKAFAQFGAGVHLGAAEACTNERPAAHCSDPEKLLLAQRTVAAALHLPVTLENHEQRFDDVALGRIEAALFEPAAHLGIEVPRPRALVFNRMSDVMFEPSNWQRFKSFVRKVRAHAEDGGGGLAASSNGNGAAAAAAALASPSAQ